LADPPLKTWNGATADARRLYGVATIGRLIKIIGLFRKRALLKRRCSAKETYNFKEPTNCSYPIAPPNRVMAPVKPYMLSCPPGSHKRSDFAYGATHFAYGVATVRRLLQMIGLCCRIHSLLQGSFSKETYYFKEPTNRSHPITSSCPFV